MSITRWSTVRLAVAALVAGTLVGVIAAGCGSDDSQKEPSATPIDRAFTAAMIPHHEGAIEMAELALERAEHRPVRKLARDIIAAQRAEIGTLRQIQRDLEESGVEQGDFGLDEHEGGTAGDLSQLERARPFDKAFIAMMIPHHEGAIRMSRKELAEGEHEGLQRIARNIISAQAREIAQMRNWSERWFGEVEQGAAHSES